MKTLFIEAQKKLNVEVNSINLKTLPEKVFLAYSIQYKKLAEGVRKKLVKLGKKVTGFKQVLGCTKLKSKVPILLVGSGRFHALNLALQGSEVYILEGKSVSKVEDNEIKKLKGRRKAALTRFLTADSVGILVSSKPGQERLKEALALKKKLEKKGKKARIFLTDTIALSELENFPIDSWVNTACPSLILDDSRVLNIDEVMINEI